MRLSSSLWNTDEINTNTWSQCRVSVDTTIVCVSMLIPCPVCCSQIESGPLPPWPLAGKVFYPIRSLCTRHLWWLLSSATEELMLIPIPNSLNAIPLTPPCRMEPAPCMSIVHLCFSHCDSPAGWYGDPWQPGRRQTRNGRYCLCRRYGGVALSPWQPMTWWTYNPAFWVAVIRYQVL